MQISCDVIERVHCIKSGSTHHRRRRCAGRTRLALFCACAPIDRVSAGGAQEEGGGGVEADPGVGVVEPEDGAVGVGEGGGVG